jgi:hypothetical protein
MYYTALCAVRVRHFYVLDKSLFQADCPFLLTRDRLSQVLKVEMALHCHFKLLTKLDCDVGVIDVLCRLYSADISVKK